MTRSADLHRYGVILLLKIIHIILSVRICCGPVLEPLPRMSAFLSQDNIPPVRIARLGNFLILEALRCLNGSLLVFTACNVASCNVTN
jgi:hypothetical protein